MMRPFLFLLPLLISTCLTANPDSLEAARLAALAEKNIPGQPDSASFYLQKSLAIWHRKNDLTQWIKTIKRLAVTYDEQGLSEPSLKIYALASQEKLPRQPASPEEWEALAWHYVNWGYTLKHSLSKFSDAVENYEKAQTIFETHLPESDPVLVADFVYRELGNIYTRFDDYEAAQVLFGKMKGIALQAKNYPLAADAYTEIGTLFFHAGDYQSAEKNYSEGLSLPQLSSVAKSILQIGLADARIALGDDAGALSLLKQAVAPLKIIVAENAHPRGKSWLSSLYATMADIFSRQKKLGLAEANLLKSLSLLKEVHQDTLCREIGKVHFALGQLYLEFLLPEKSLQHYQSALQCVLPDFKSQDATTNPAAEKFYAENTILEALGGKAAAFEALFQKEPERRVFLEKSLECHELLFEAEQEYRRVHHYESSRLGTLAEASQRAESAIRTAWHAHESWKENTWLEKAWQFSERSKSNLLYEALRHSDAGSMANVPKNLLRQEQELNEAATQLEKALFLEKQKGAPAEKIGALQSQLFNTNKDLADLRGKIEKDFPAFYQLKYKQNVASLRQTQQLLNGDQALIEYFVGDNNLFIFLVKKDRFTAERLPKNFPLEQWVSEFRQGIEAFQFSSSNRDSLCTAYTELAQKLYQKLLQPLEKHGLPKNLIIVPGGVLGFLPFDALLTEAPAEPCRFRSYPYLVRRHVISYNYSSTLFKELSEGKRRHASADFAAFAPKFSEGNASGFGALQFNIASAEGVRNLVGGKIYPGAAASGQAFMANAEKFRLLYLATHAKANTDEGAFSFVILANEAGGYDTVFVKDIYNLPLAADLVFLGACETGSGKMHNGEGIISLARSFLYAGARSIVTTLWSINDESNKDLTISFFHHLSGGERKDVALQLAKLEQLENSPHDLYAHPVFWAAYTPIGNMEPVKNGFAGWIVMAGIVMAGLALFALRKKFKPHFLRWARMRSGMKTQTS